MEQEHNWVPTDNQGYAMECTKCSIFISYYENEEWNKQQSLPCEGKEE